MSESSQRRGYQNSFHSALRELERHLTATKEPFFGGSEYGMADLHGYPAFERFPAVDKFGIDVLPSDKFPRLTAWVSCMQQLDCVRKCWISTELHHQYLVGYRTGSVDYDVEMDAETIAMQRSVV